MKLTHLALAASLGMVLTGGIVYRLTVPPGPGEETGRDAPEGTAAAEGAPATLTPLTELSLPIPASPPPIVAASGEAAIPTAPEEAPLVPKQRARPSSTPSLGNGCLKPQGEAVFNVLVSRVPGLRQLPPERFDLVRRVFLEGSEGCTCVPGYEGEVRCVDWCSAKGFAGGSCEPRGLCRCR